MPDISVQSLKDALGGAEVSGATFTAQMMMRVRQYVYRPAVRIDGADVTFPTRLSVTLVDGEPEATITLDAAPANCWWQLSVADSAGHSVTRNVVKVTAVSGGSVTAISVYTQGIYSVAPDTPTAQASATGSGTGASFGTTFQTLGGSDIDDATSHTSPSDAAKYEFLGRTLTNINSSGFYGSSVGNDKHSVFRWATSTRRIVIRLVGLNTKFELLVDGEYVPLPSYTTDSSGMWYSLVLDFGTAAWREFELIAFNMAFGGIRVDNGGLCIPRTSTRKPLAISLGDSYTAGNGARSAGSTHAYTMARILGLDLVSDGYGGAGWNSTGNLVPAKRITDAAGTLNRIADVEYVFFDLGYNDAGGNMTTAASAFDAAVAAVDSIAPEAKIICFGPATPQGATSNLNLVRDMLIARCNAHGIEFVDQRDLLNMVNEARYVTSDNIHPSIEGHRVLGAWRSVQVRPLLR